MRKDKLLILLAAGIGLYSLSKLYSKPAVRVKWYTELAGTLLGTGNTISVTIFPSPNSWAGGYYAVIRIEDGSGGEGVLWKGTERLSKELARKSVEAIIPTLRARYGW